MSTLSKTANQSQGLNDLSRDAKDLKNDLIEDVKNIKQSGEKIGSELYKEIMEDSKKLKQDGEKLVNELYKEGIHALADVEENIKESTEELVEKIKVHPIASVLVAAGFGFLLSTLLKK